MQSLFNLTTGDLVRGFNFISKICAAELGEINILPTDRIVTSACDADYLWNRAKNAENDHVEFLNAGYKRVYRTHFGGNESYDDMDFHIYISNLDNSYSVLYLREAKFTKDQQASINVIIPDLSKVVGDKIVSKDMIIYKVIYNIFNYFLNINHDPCICGSGTAILHEVSALNKSSISYIRKLSSVFTLLTGLFPEEFVPEQEMSQELINISDTMFHDQTLIGRAKEGHVVIMGVGGYHLFDYLYEIGSIID